VTDGPFPESKEFHHRVLDRRLCHPERAYEIAARASAAPGSGGVPLNIPIEVRPIPGGPRRDV
jgi:hypothetical protein